MSGLKRFEIPGWLLRLNERVPNFSEAGLGGLLDYHRLTNALGEKLARGEIMSEDLAQFVFGGNETASDPVNLQQFWSEAWAEILGRKIIEVPPLKIRPKTVAALERFGFRVIYLPKITEEDYPSDFVKPAWRKHLTQEEIKRRPLEGLWIAVETIAKPNWNDPQDYGNGEDPLAEAIVLGGSRFSKSWDELKETFLPHIADVLELSRRAVRLPSAEEWNLIGNLFLWLNRHKGEHLPDLGSTDSWEWCENSCGSGSRLLVGDRDNGGLAGVLRHWHGRRHDDIGFRALAVL